MKNRVRSWVVLGVLFAVYTVVTFALPTAGLPVEIFVLLGLYAGLRREESLALQWDCVVLEKETSYIQIRRTWHTEHNQPVVTETLKTPAAKRDIPIPPILENHLRQLKATTVSDFSFQIAKANRLAVLNGVIIGIK